MRYEGCEESLRYIEQVLQDEGPFDGVIGFSQGAVLAHLLLAGGAHPELRCAICISGFVCRDPTHAASPGRAACPSSSFRLLYSLCFLVFIMFSIVSLCSSLFSLSVVRFIHLSFLFVLYFVLLPSS